MTARRVFRLILVVAALALAAYNLGLFRPSGSSPAATTSPRRDPVVVEVPPSAIGRDVTTSVSLRDLARDEARGGHTIARHVGKTDADLRARLEREPGIPAASTYTDVPTAARVVAATLDREADTVRRWSSRQGRRPNLALDYAGPPGEVIGRSLARAVDEAVACHQAVVVLKWDTAAHDYFVLTSYPEVRDGSR